MSLIESGKIVGAILIALVTIGIISLIGDALVAPGESERHPVAVVEADKKPQTEAVSAVSSAATPAPKAALEAVGTLLAAADADKGKKVFKKCKACHTAENGGANKIGPNLWNIVNADVARPNGFSYSGAMKAKEGNWSYESLDAFLSKPKAHIKGTKMVFAGVKKAGDRANLIAFLRSLSDSPAPLP